MTDVYKSLQKPYNPIINSNVNTYKIIDNKNTGFFIVHATNTNKAIELVAQDLYTERIAPLVFNNIKQAHEYVIKNCKISKITKETVIVASYENENVYESKYVTEVIDEYLR